MVCCLVQPGPARPLLCRQPAFFLYGNIPGKKSRKPAVFIQQYQALGIPVRPGPIRCKCAEAGLSCMQHIAPAQISRRNPAACKLPGQCFICLILYHAFCKNNLSNAIAAVYCFFQPADMVLVKM